MKQYKLPPHQNKRKDFSSNITMKAMTDIYYRKKSASMNWSTVADRVLNELKASRKQVPVSKFHFVVAIGQIIAKK